VLRRWSCSCCAASSCCCRSSSARSARCLPRGMG
jgi:hypothetical protein